MKISKSDRNIKRTFKSTDIEGYRGGEEVETLVNYIENEKQDKSKSKKKPNITDEKMKKKINKKNKVKRYNSLEELRSTKEFADDETQINTEKSYSSKNLDRYSWGKAEISFLQSSNTNPDSDISNTTNDIWSTFSMESLINDSSGFNLVTNKKKSRKRMLCKDLYDKDSKTQYSEINKCTSSKAKTQLHKKSLVNEKKIDRLLKGRRKSLSSVPQSESECSDVESVHSLPGYTKHPSKAESCPSYAEITRKSSKIQTTDIGKIESMEITPTTINYRKKKDGEKCIEQKIENKKEDPIIFNSFDNEFQKVLTNPRNMSELSTTKQQSDQINKTCEDLKKDKQRKTKNFVNQPAVIMKDCNVSDVNELVFGFDINKDLLCDDMCSSRNKDNRNSGLVSKPNRSSTETLNTTCLEFNDSQKTRQVKSMKLLNCPTNRSSSDLENIVNFVSSGN